VSECDREASIMRKPWPTRGCCATGKKSKLLFMRFRFWIATGIFSLLQSTQNGCPTTLLPVGRVVLPSVVKRPEREADPRFCQVQRFECTKSHYSTHIRVHGFFKFITESKPSYYDAISIQPHFKMKLNFDFVLFS
jgi:hypothetical protein